MSRCTAAVQYNKVQYTDSVTIRPLQLIFPNYRLEDNNVFELLAGCGKIK